MVHPGGQVSTHLNLHFGVYVASWDGRREPAQNIPIAKPCVYTSTRFLAEVPCFPITFRTISGCPASAFWPCLSWRSVWKSLSGRRFRQVRKINRNLAHRQGTSSRIPTGKTLLPPLGGRRAIPGRMPFRRKKRSHLRLRDQSGRRRSKACPTIPSRSTCHW